MKKILSSLFFIGSAAALFTSCKKDQFAKPADTMPETVAATSTASTNGKFLPAAPTYTLTRRDKDSVVYYNDGRLAKVLNGSASYVQYNYGFNTVIAKEYTLPNNQLKKEMVYQIDPQLGRVYEAKSTVYSYNNNGVIVITKTLKYDYNPDGHIKKQYNIDKPLERSLFSWGDDGDITAVYFFNDKGAQYAIVQFPTLPAEDKLKLQPKRSQLDPYLKIFGKGFRHMIGRELVHTDPNLPPITDEILSYSYNTDGYPVSCTVTDNITKNIIADFTYSYLAKRGM
jgi:hypothetical protein